MQFVPQLKAVFFDIGNTLGTVSGTDPVEFTPIVPVIFSRKILWQPAAWSWAVSPVTGDARQRREIRHIAGALSIVTVGHAITGGRGLAVLSLQIQPSASCDRLSSLRSGMTTREFKLRQYPARIPLRDLGDNGEQRRAVAV
jgi:hypothetical protein